MADAPPPLPRPKLPRRGSGSAPQRNATFIALVGLLVAATGFAVLVAAVMTGFAPAGIAVIILVVGGVGFLFGGHYLVWGIWLDRMHASRGQAGPVEFWRRAHVPEPLDDSAEPESDG
jgi:hypothetical protein